MLRRCATRLSPRASSGTRPPHVVLGLPSDATEEQVKDAFKALARKWHPDMPGGDAKKFKEVNAAYSTMKAQRARGLRGESSDPGSAAGGGDDGENGEDIMARKMREHMKRYHEERERGRPKTTQEMMWDDEVYEIGILCATWLLVGIALFDRWATRQRNVWETDMQVASKATNSTEFRELLEKQANLRKTDETTDASGVAEGGVVGLSKPIPDVSNAAKAYTAQEKGNYFNRQRRSQQRFTDLQEFFLVFDTDHVTERRITTSQMSSDRIAEGKLGERCAMVKRINTTEDPRQYSKVAEEIMERIATTEWAYVDAGPTMLKVVEGVKRVAKLNPADHRATLLEYQSKDESTSRCYAAIVNERYTPGTGRTQRVIVTGKENFQPRHALSRVRDLEQGFLAKEALVLPGSVPMKAET